MISASDRTGPGRTGGARRAWLLSLVVSMAAALAIVAPFYGRGNASGHDFEFHATSWLDVAGQWKQGTLYPRWAEWANWGFGEPRFVFYPPLSWMFGAALGLTVGWTACVPAFLVLTQAVAGLCMFALARRTMPLRAALFAGAVYAANPYAQLVAYLRSDFAELLGAAFFPLLILFGVHLAEAADSRTVRRGTALFAAVFALVWLCNAPVGVLASYSTALLFAVMAAQQRSWRPLARGAGGFGLGFGLCAFYLLPAAYEQRWVNIAQALSAGLQPAENFLYTTIQNPEHNWFNWIASSTAVGMIVLTGLAAVAAHRKDENEKQWQLLVLLAAASTVLMFRFTAPLWELLPKLRFLQFPWRWMLPLAVPFAWLAAGSVARRRFGGIAAGGIILVLAAAGTYFVQHGWWDKEDIPALRAAIARGDGYEGTDEYDPRGDDHTDLPQHTPRAKLLPANEESATAVQGEVHIERWRAEEKRVQVKTRGPVKMALRLLNYPGWRVEVNGSTVRPEHAEGTAQMIVPLEAGESRVSVHFARTPDRALGIGFSLASLFVFLVVLRFRSQQEG